MCTLIALHRCVPQWPLVVAANRDEYRDRPAEGLAVRWSRGRRLVAPADRRAGGTWLGVNEAGLFAGLTNRPTRTPDPERRSRGLLVLDALAEASAADAARALERLPRGTYNPFNLLVADGRDAFVVVYEERPAVVELIPGVHVVGNADPDDAAHPKTARILNRARRVAAEPGAAPLEALAELCRDHEDEGGPLSAACVHAGGYGTRSSTLLRLGSEPGQGALRHAEGPPCRADYEDWTPLLHEIRPRAGLAAGI